MMNRVDVYKEIGKNYNSFWHCKKRYRVVKGSRGSKKSCTTALWYIYYMMYYPAVYGLNPNVLVIRRYYNTHRDSTRAQLVWAIKKLNVEHLWKIPKAENTLTYLPTGQQILFRGLDDAQSITSITVSTGYLCWVWFEEAFQCSEDDFNKVDMSIRGEIPEPLFKQFTLTFNPWSDKSWLKRRFFDIQDDAIFAVTTTYKQNEFLGQDDINIYEKMKVQNPKRYRIEGEGEWGIAEGLIYENWIEKEFDVEELIRQNVGKKDNRGLPNLVPCNGMDFGYNDPTAFIGAYCDKKNYKIYIYHEFCEVAMSNRKIANALIIAGFDNCKIIADSEDPRTINELRLLGLHGIRPAKKGAGSVVGGIQKLQDYQLIVHPRCVHTIESLSNYAWKKDKMSNAVMNEPEHEFSHCCDALRYGCEELQKFGIQV